MFNNCNTFSALATSFSSSSSELRGGYKFYEFNFVKLMLTYQPPGITAMRTGLGPETCGIGHIVDGQVFFLQYLVTMEVRYRNFRGGHQIVIPAFELEGIFGEFG